LQVDQKSRRGQQLFSFRLILGSKSSAILKNANPRPRRNGAAETAFENSLAGGGWTPVSVTPQIVNGQWQAVLPISGNTQQFYQLQK
jgi:hypothetical protein